MAKLNTLDWITLILVIIGGINWVLIGIFAFNLVSFIFGQMSWLTRLVYILVGLSAVYIAIVSPKFRKSGPTKTA